MPDTVRGADVSNYQGDISAELPLWQADGIEHLVVRLSTETTHHRQLALNQLREAHGDGLSCSGYVWCYWGEDPVACVGASLDLADAAGVPLSMIWLDAEDDVQAGEDVIAWLHAAVGAVRTRGRQPGIYTGGWWWGPHVGVGGAFADLPLWTAEYDNVPDLDVVTLYGGWTRAAGKQYGGAGLDLDVFDRAVTLPEGEDPAMIAELEQQLAAKQAELNGVVTGLAYVADIEAPKAALSRLKTQRQAALAEIQRVRVQVLGPKP